MLAKNLQQLILFALIITVTSANVPTVVPVVVGIPPVHSIPITCLVWNVLLHESETWTTRKQDRDRVKVIEMWIWIRWVDM